MKLLRFSLIGAVMLAGSASHASAQQLETRADLELILDDAIQAENFEGVSLHAGGQLPVANPLNSDTGAAFLGIQPGVTYSSPESLAIVGTFTNGKENNILRSDLQLDIVFDEPQRAVGFDLFGSSAISTVSFFGESGLLGVAVIDHAQVAGAPFAGWQDQIFGITSVRATVVGVNAVFTDNITWGRVVPPCPADFALPAGSLDFSDVLAFLVAFGDGEDNADLTVPYGVWDFSDIVFFLTAFGAGCP